MEDALVHEAVISLNIVRVKLLARIAALELVYDNKEHIRDDIDRFTRAKDHLVASLLFIQATHFADVDTQLELPF